MKAAYLLCFVFVASILIGCAQTGKSEMKFDLLERGGQHSKTFEKTVTKTLSINYLLFLPETYGREQKSWPMILFLHGAGERGGMDKVLNAAAMTYVAAVASSVAKRPTTAGDRSRIDLSKTVRDRVVRLRERLSTRSGKERPVGQGGRSDLEA